VAPVRLRALPLAAALASAAACGQRAPESCPGERLATLQLHAVLVSTGCLRPPSGWPWAPQSLWVRNGIPLSIPDDPDPTDQDVPTFDASFETTAGAGGGADGLAYCSGGAHAVPLLGTRSGAHVRVERTLERGAVLGSCGAACTPSTSITVEGELTGEPPTAFSGTLTEHLEAAPADCAPCVVPCTSTYSLTGGS